jgi:hypothetical protein
MRGGAILIPILLLGCSEKFVRLTPIGGERGDLLIAIRADAKGTPIEVASSVLPETAEFRIGSGDPDSIVLLLSVKRSDLVHADGSPLDAAALAAARVRLTDRPRGDGGSCARCLAPELHPPQAIHPGDSCSVPPFAAVSAFRLHGSSAESVPALSEAGALRAAVRIDWPGDCACPLETPKQGRTLEICPLGGTSPFAPKEIALSGDGTLFAVTQGIASFFPVGAQGATLRVRPAMREIEGVAALPEPGRFVVSTRRTATSVGGTSFRIFDAASGTTELGGELRDSARVRLVPLPGSDWIEALGALAASGEAYAGQCRFPPGTAAECRSLAIDSRAACPHLQQPIRAIRSAASLRGGDAAAITAGGALLFRLEGASTWQCLAGATVPLTIGSTVTAKYNEAQVESLGRRLFFCMTGFSVNSADNSGLGVVATATVPPLTLAPGGALADFDPQIKIIRFLADGPQASCRKLFRDPARPDRVFAWMLGTTRQWVDEIDPDGTIVAVHPSVASVLGAVPGVDLLEVGGSGYAAASDPSGALHRRRPRDAAFTRLTETSTLAPDVHIALAAGGPSEVAAFAPGRAPIVVTAVAQPKSCADVRVESTRGDIVPWDAVDAASVDSSGVRRFFLSGRKGAKTRLGRVALGGAFDEVPGFEGDTAFTAVAERAPGVFVLLAADGRLFAADDHGVSSIATRWDDPDASGEGAPPAGYAGWTALDPRAEWIAGQGAIGRLVQSESGFEVRGYSPSAVSSSGPSPTAYRAIRSVCADELLMASVEDYVLAPGMAANQVGLWQAIGVGEDGRVRIDPDPLFDRTDFAVPISYERAYAVMWASAAPVFAFTTSRDSATLYRAGAERMTLPFDTLSASAESSVLLVFARTGARIAAAFEPRP